jgi:membrane protease YdiL (CAAX protease family)
LFIGLAPSSLAPALSSRKLKPYISMAEQSFFAKFIGTKRWKALFDTLRMEFANPIKADKGFLDIFIALLLCSLGPIAAALEVKFQANSSLYSTMSFGISAVFAILLQRKIQRVKGAMTSKQSFSLTHTAFALGCIPALLVVALDPSLLAKREQLLSTSSQGSVAQISKLTFLFYISVFTLWVAVTEEYLFRGLLISIIRRSCIFNTPQVRTIIACLLSSILFGISHYPLWGLGASLALTGIGLGLALGYIANGERIWPMILYHWGFDFLSTSLAMLS